MKLRDRVAIVTGGGRGIGKAIVRRFAAEGALVAVTGTSRDLLEATAREVVADGGKAVAIVADVSDEKAVAAMVARVAKELGGIDILVNNAGVSGPTATVAEMPVAEWERTLAVNLTGAMICARYAIPHIVTGGRRRAPDQFSGGRIINIASVAGQIGYALRSPYAASKWGMIGLTRSLAVELGPEGVTVNAIAPGSTRGDRIGDVVRTRAAALGKTPDEIEREFFIDANALKRMVEPEEIAATAAFLASDEARNITGETIAVSAGFRL
ncbi:MAG: SDR family oxidoreductase [Candidatus Eisenbacteria bacterium]|nr:SDR family oxidoreductase [Candidatus Eisenbacteria bacterium]